MSKKAERIAFFYRSLGSMGISYPDIDALRRIEMTLSRWSELECGTDAGHIERDEKTGKPRFFNARARFIQANDPRAYSIIPDREAGALKRLAVIMKRYPKLAAYHQGDPRGCSLYVYPKNKLKAGQSIDSYYSSYGIAVCY